MLIIDSEIQIIHQNLNQLYSRGFINLTPPLERNIGFTSMTSTFYFDLLQIQASKNAHKLRKKSIYCF